jgi:pimeloyl-ACP methyl ester carboxylesterase
MRTRLAVLLAAVTVPLLAVGGPGVAGPAHPERTGRGELLSVTVIAHLDPVEVAARLEQGGFSAAEVRTGVTAYRILYRTVDGQGRPARASGLVVLPDAGDGPLRLVLHAHGTKTMKKYVASRFRDPYETGPALTFAAAGFATAAPDYLGLGDGPGPQSWFDVPTETTAEVDMLRATRELATEQGRLLRRGVDVTGFSQGASAALGLARELERRPDGQSTLHALAPVSGAYDFRDVELPAVLDGRVDPQAAVVYASLMFVSWNRIHHLYDDPREVFRAPYAGRVTRLMNGHTPGGQMMRGLPGSVGELLTPAGRRMLERPTGAFARALAVADRVCDWHPRAPTRLYYAEHDEQAVPGNTRSCHAAFAERGVSVPVRNLGPTDALGSRHLGSNVTGSLAAVRWFLRLG